MERSTFNSGAEQYCSGAETALKAAFLVRTEALSGTLSMTLRFTIRYSVNIASIKNQLIHSDSTSNVDKKWSKIHDDLMRPHIQTFNAL